MASEQILEKEFGETPILLLDDVFSDLDELKRINLKSMIGMHSQIFLACSRKNDIPFEVDNIIEIKSGTVVK